MKGLNYLTKNNKGVALLIAITIMMVAALIVIPLLRQQVNERTMIERTAESVRAFYAAESAINVAITAINSYSDLNDFEDWRAGDWDVDTDPLSYTLPPKALVLTGYDDPPTYAIALNNPSTEVPFVVVTGTSTKPSQQPTPPTKSLMVDLMRAQSAIIAKDSVEIKGHAQINVPDGMDPVLEGANFSFEAVFKDTIQNIKDLDDTDVVGDPENNYLDVQTDADTYNDLNENLQWDIGEPFIDDWNGDGDWGDVKKITWFQLSDADPPNEAAITANDWTGKGADNDPNSNNGILVVAN